jgi:CheY-like chemotaxis protein
MALELFRSRRFGAVITDCNMPEMSGYELARSIRAWEDACGRARTPILACTASALPSEAAACADAGMDDYLVKPAQLEPLARRLDSWLPTQRVAAVPDVPSIEAGATDSLVDQRLLDAITGGKPHEQAKVLSEFARLNREDADKLRRSLVQAPDLQQATLFAHRIQGSSRMLGASALAVACQELESAGRAGDIERARALLGNFERELSRLDGWVEARCRVLLGNP